MKAFASSTWTPAAWNYCTGVEDALDVTMAQRTELDYLIYNDPLGYADLILNGNPKEYLRNVAGATPCLCQRRMRCSTQRDVCFRKS